MNRRLLGGACLLGMSTAGAALWLAGDWLPALTARTAVAQQAPSPARQPLYYQDPSGRPEYSAAPRKAADGRDFVPVYEDIGAPPQAAAPARASSGGHGRILYYRNPMGLPDTSPVPKKDSMGMDYIPVYEDEANQPTGTVTVSPERVQMLGVRTEAAAERTMTRSIRAVGTIAVDERRLAVVAPRFEGWIQRLLVNETGQPVRRGQPLFEVYSPELAAAEQEYVIARQAEGAMAHADPAMRSGTAGIAAAALARLRNFDLPAEEVVRLRRTGRVSRTLTLTAPMDGVVLEKVAIQGMRFAPGDTLYRIADLSTVWLLADVFEQDLGLVGPGQEASIAITAYPDRRFTGKVTFVYPTLNAATRTAKVRIEIPNPEQLLKPDMYATVEVAAPLGSTPVVAVPDSAVLDSGTRQVVLVERAPGRYEPRPVATGRRADGQVEIRQGIRAGERVVVGANFLIDAESNLRAALQPFAAPPTPTQEGQRP
ncbi:efflux RND transporter periplasmic adaptor subunit [Siccirubricoccus sp. KC 17139]|uniref:Efflux RND transporter periplasmic adaptor subunit n=1 Tax=Siccirubricoccus soli TaxID=2899147 RepID=A0ABT1D2N1_9PROT|nr:efflux RND transporter periplasmic adaptor subunit [Siccirubricoccus soli]MCO6416157.1 efflux RND transporter periplasmic adaptor subunit [Siccirubricoccus soli]MCP2682291.1 efflux RND transporter periplasmic adaptor subunit [Siccirubricoccus soli]